MPKTQSRPAATPPVKSPSNEADDRDLAVRLAQGRTSSRDGAAADDAALDDLVRCYQKRVAGLAYRLLGWSDGVDDVVQEVFLRVLGSRAGFRGQSSLWTFLAAITVNCCRSALRRRWLRTQWEHFHKGAEAAAAEASDEHAVRDETAAQVRAAVARLPAKYREAMVLRYLEELSIDDVAVALAVWRNVVEVRLSRGRKRLEAMLANLVDE